MNARIRESRLTALDRFIPWRAQRTFVEPGDAFGFKTLWAGSRAENIAHLVVWAYQQSLTIEQMLRILNVMAVETAIMLARYSDWADQVLFKAMESLPEGAVYQKSETLFGSMVGTLNHNYVVDLIWRAHLLGEKHGFSTRRDVPYPNLEDLIEAQSKLNQWYSNWAAEQTSESFSERLKFNFVTGKPGEMIRGAMFLHVVNHKTYHRGWVSQMFFGFGMNPPETDLCVFLCNA